MVRHLGYSRQGVAPLWVAYAEWVLSQPVGAVVQPGIGVAPLLAGASVSLYSGSVDLTAAMRHQVSTAWCRTMA